MKQSTVINSTVILLAGALLTGCGTPQYQENQSAFNQGAIGAALGAIAGGVIGNNSHGAFGNREGMVAGAALGALLGGTMGHQADQSNARIGAVADMASSVVINVQNSNGSYTPVTLRRAGNQYIGPRGEYYSALPTEKQLKVAYGF